MAWQFVGSVNIGPASDRVEVGPVQVPRAGGLRVKVVQGGSTPFQFGYCLLSFESTYGRELGTIKVYPRPTVTSYILGEGLEPVDPYGKLILEPRTWNLRWIKAGFPLSVGVLADLPSLLPADRVLPPGFADAFGADLALTASDPPGRLIF